MPAVFTPNVIAKPSGRWTCAITLLALQVFQPRHRRCCSERYSAVRRTRRLLCDPAGSAAAAQILAATIRKNFIRGMAGRILLLILFPKRPKETERSNTRHHSAWQLLYERVTAN